MKIELKKIDKLKRVMKVEITGDELTKDKHEVYRQKSKQLKVPGFRPGNAPLDVLEKHHGNFLREEFLKKSLPSFYSKAIKDSQLSPAGLPKIYDIQHDPDILVFFAEFEIKPEIDAQESLYKGIKIKDKKIEVKEDEIEKILTSLKEGIKKSVDKDLADEELAKWTSYPDVDSLKEAIKGQLFVEKLKERRQKIDNQIKNHLLKVFKLDLPKSEVDKHHKECVDREVYNLRNRGVSQEDLDKHKKDIEEKLRPLAENDVRLFYILETIAREEGVKVDSNLGEIVLGFILSHGQYEKIR